jgi:hypothetical protein
LDDDGNMDSDEIEVLDGEETRKQKLIEIFCNRWKGRTSALFLGRFLGRFLVSAFSLVSSLQRHFLLVTFDENA